MEKTKNLAIIVLVVVFGISLYFNFSNQNRSKNLETNSDLAKANNEDLFEQKQECQQYQAIIEKKLKELDFYNPETKYQTSNFLEKIFFSPKANTCLYVAKEWGWVDKKITYETLTLEDALTGEILLSSLREMGSKEYLQEKQGFEEYLKEYE